MFYSYDILSKRHGKFGIIWIAATKAVNPTRREYLAVDIPKSCEDIVRMLTLRADPFVTGGQRPRLSLYLSSQLMYGCVKVFKKQRDYLISDLMELNMKFRSSFGRGVPIDLVPLTDRTTQVRGLVDVPLSPSLMDPDFGKMRYDAFGDLSLDRIPEVEVWQPLPDADSPTRGGPDIPLPSTPPQPHRVSPRRPSRRRSHQSDLNDSYQARNADITLIEEPVPPSAMGPGSMDQLLRPGQLDLPPMTAEAIAELDAAGEMTGEKATDDEPRPKRPRRASIAMTPVYVGASGDDEERQRQLTQQQHEFEEKLEAQQRIIDEILERNDGDSQDMATSDAEDLDRERAKLHQMQEEFEESLRHAEFEADMREAESEAEQQQRAAMGIYQPDIDMQTVDQVQLVPPVTDATMQDDGRLAPADETPAIMLGIPPDQIDVRPQKNGLPTPGVTPGSPSGPGAGDERHRRREQFRLQLSPVAAGQATARHRRHLRFADVETQMKRDTIQSNMRNTREILKNNEVPDLYYRNATQLFENPTRGLSKRLKRLWKRNTITKSVAWDSEDRSVWGVPGLVSSSESESDRTPLAKQLDDLTLSPVRPVDEQQIAEQQEQDIQLQMEQEAQQMATDVSAAEMARDATRELSVAQESMEVMRDASKSRSSSDDFPERSLMSRSAPEETPDTENRSKTRRSKKSSPEDAPVKSTTTTPEVTEMSMIQEERELQASPVLPPAPTVPATFIEQPTIVVGEDLESSEVRHRVERIIKNNTEYDDVTTFKAVCSTNNNRKTAALMFCALLGLCKRQKVIVQQEEPYSDIFIARGERLN